MRGIILDFDPATSTGRISGDDGNRYGFVSASLQSGATVRSGQAVDFVPDGDSATQIVTLTATPPPSSSMNQGSFGGLQMEPPFDFRTAMFSFQGRLRRQHFWISWLILLGIGVVLGWIPVLGALMSLGLIWPNLAITVKRLHDMGQTGWLAAIPYVVSFVGMIIGISIMGVSMFTNMEALENEDPAAIIALLGPIFGIFGLAFLVSVGFLIWIGATESQPGENRFGPNPKNPAGSGALN